MAAFRFPGIRPAYSLARRIFYGRSLETDGHRRILGFGGDCRHHRHCSGHFGPRGQRRRRRGGRGRKAHLLDHWLCEQHTAVPPTPVPPTSVPYCDLYPLSCITPVRPTAVPPTAIPPTDPPPPTDTPVPPPTNTPKPPPTNTPKPPITVAPPPTSTPRPEDGDANPTNTPRPPTPTPTPGGQTVTLPSSGTVITWPPDEADPTDHYPVPTYAQVVAATNDYFDAPSGIHRRPWPRWNCTCSARDPVPTTRISCHHRRFPPNVQTVRPERGKSLSPSRSTAWMAAPCMRTIAWWLRSNCQETSNSA